LQTGARCVVEQSNDWGRKVEERGEVVLGDGSGARHCDSRSSSSAHGLEADGLGSESPRGGAACF
jgi:hypothetical protein